MTEYDQLCYFLGNDFVHEKQDKMEEKKGEIHKAQIVNIDDCKRKITWTLYRFDLDEKDFLPFFNKTDNAPEGLRKFCDYVLLVKYHEKTYVLLVELKRGDISGADKQLKASQVFIEFLYKTAERLHRDFNDFDFNKENVVLRKIIVKETKSNKKTLKDDLQIDKNADIILFKSSGSFPVVKFL